MEQVSGGARFIASILLIIWPLTVSAGVPCPSGAVRPQTSRLAAAFCSGLAGSPTFRRLVHGLAGKRLTVVVREGECQRPALSCLWLAETPGPFRTLHVNMDIRSIGSASYLSHRHALTAQMAHELQHAAEIAAHDDVVDAEGISGLYRRIGERRDHGRNERWETDAAVAVQLAVIAELRH